jgi:hypothetical protein
MKRAVDTLVNRCNYIPDGMLEAYLEGKNLTPPSSWTEPKHVAIHSRYKDAMDRQAQLRRFENQRVAREYGLKRPT